MDKKILALLITPSLLVTWDCACANETHEYITKSDDDNKQGRGSREGRDDSRGSGGDQNKGRDRGSQRQQVKQEIQQRRSGGGEQGSERQQVKQEIQQRRSGGDEQGSQRQQVKQEIQQRRSGGGDQDSQRQQPQKQRDFEGNRDQNRRKENIEQIKRKWEGERKDSQERSSGGRIWDRKDDKKDSSDPKRSWGSDKSDGVRTSSDGSRDGRARISKERFKERENRWQSKSKEWRHNFSSYRKRDHIFDDHFWDNFRRRHNHWSFDNNFQWYSRATWPRVVVWLPWQWSQPIYYYYETDGDVYYSTTEDFAYLTPVDSKETFISQAVRIANARYPIPQQQSDWMPLGMFTVASEYDSSDTPKQFLSLAISKQGAVTGAYYDAASNSTLEIQGGIDPESQRIAWKFVGSEWPIMESGLFNLTKEESTLLIHTSSSTTETRLLIRLDQN